MSTSICDVPDRAQRWWGERTSQRIVPRLTLLVVLVSLVVMPVGAGAQVPYLVKDINTTTTPVDSSPSMGQCLGGVCLFVANDRAHGIEPWRTDGTAAGTLLLKDIRPGTASSVTSAGFQGPLNGRFFFTADDGVHGKELWATDGSPEGTYLVKDIAPGADTSSPQLGPVLDGWLFFWATTAESGTELWRSDGSEAGTTLFRDIVPGPESGGGGSMATLGGNLLYFTAQGLWNSEGSGSSLVLLSMVRGWFIGGAGSLLFFRVELADSTLELWRTDGTGPGTWRVMGGFVQRSGAMWYGHEIDSVLVFAADDGVSGLEPWRSDGTPEGTFLLADLNPATASSRPVFMTVVDGGLLFEADDGVHGHELWRTDGTAAGTVLVKDINPGAPSGDPFGAAVVDGAVMLSASDGVHGSELWRTDGTPEGTVLVRDICPGMYSSMSRRDFVAADGFVIFPANDGATGMELWRTDGTEAGTTLVRNIAADAPNSSYPMWFTSLGSTLVFPAWDGAASRLWRSDGSEDGTVPLATIGPDPFDGQAYVVDAAGLGFFLAGTTQVPVLWRTDGTPEGTFSLTASITTAFLVGSPGRLFFAGSDPDHGPELWRSTGTDAGTGLVRDIRPGPDGSLAYPGSPCFANGRLFFSADDGGSNGRNPWVSDGTEIGTSKLKDIDRWSGSPMYFTSVGDQVYFIQYVHDSAFELWRSDGTTDGTVLVRSFENLSPARHLTAAGNRLFFVTSGQLWVSDGSESGTRFVADVHASYFSLAPGLTAFHDQLFFIVENADHTYSLWRSDGTSAGTRVIKELGFPPPVVQQTPPLVPFGGRLYFEGWDQEHGVELWVTDGTSEGTVLAADIVPGAGSSAPELLTPVGTTLYFRATTPENGAEPWAMPVPAVANPRLTWAVIHSSNQMSPFGQPVTLTVNVEAGAGTPSGTITLWDGTTMLATMRLIPTGDSSASASFTSSTLDAGDHPLLAQYSGDAAHDPAQSLPTNQIIVPAPSSISLASSTNPSAPGQAFTLTATVETGLAVAATGAVTFSDAASGVLGSADLDGAGQAHLTLMGLPGGTHFLSAAYAGEPRFQPSASSLMRQGVGGSCSCPSFTGVGQVRASGCVYTPDLNADGRADVLVGGSGGLVSLSLSGADGRPEGLTSFWLPTSGMTSAVFADFDDDGSIDLAAVGGWITVMLNDGSGHFRQGWNCNICLVSGVATADFNSDGSPDIALVYGGSMQLALNDGHGGFTLGPTCSVGSGAMVATSADFDGDGKADLAVSGDQGGHIWIDLGNGDGTFRPPVAYATGSSAISFVAAADLNRDGHPDLVASSPISRDLVVLLGVGDGTFGPAAHYPVQQAAMFPTSVAVGDFNGDAVPDLLAVPDGNHDADVELFLGDGSGAFRPPERVTQFQRALSAAGGDFNGDGRLDLALLDSDYSLNVLLNACGPFPTGDANGDGALGVGDVFYLINNLFAGGPPPAGDGDVNKDGQVNVADVFYLINFLFARGPAPL